MGKVDGRIHQEREEFKGVVSKANASQAAAKSAQRRGESHLHGVPQRVQGRGRRQVIPPVSCRRGSATRGLVLPSRARPRSGAAPRVESRRRSARPSLLLPFLDLTGPTIETNLALDEALLIAAEERGEGPVLRSWEPSALAVVLGVAACRSGDDVHVELCRAEGVTLAPRSSGGGTVLIGPGDFCFTVVLPADAGPRTPRGRFRAGVCSGSVRVLSAFGTARGSARSRRLTIGARKFTGGVQRRLRRWFLVHLELALRFSG